MNIYICTLLLLLAAGLLLFLHRPKQQANAGEMEVRRRLRRLRRRKYRVANDVMLRSGRGSTEYTQIDHVVVSIYGIFSIETKDYKGEIHGTESGSHWTQQLHGHTYRFMNPIRQNYAHVKALAAFLREEGYADIPVYSIVTFPEDTVLWVNAEEAQVVGWSALVRTVKELSRERCLTKKEMCALHTMLSKKKSTYRGMRRHTADIADAKKKQARKIRAAVCPRCGGDLVLRRGKNGRFYGCSRFPKCRFTEELG